MFATNCGGFAPGPLRPKTEHRPGVSVIKDSLSTERTNTNYSREELIVFCN